MERYERKGRAPFWRWQGKAMQGTITENTWLDRVLSIHPHSRQQVLCCIVPDNNNDDDGVSKCRFTITVFLPPCNMRPVYLLPPSLSILTRFPKTATCVLILLLLALLFLQKGSTYVLLEQTKVGEAKTFFFSLKIRAYAHFCCEKKKWGIH